MSNRKKLISLFLSVFTLILFLWACKSDEPEVSLSPSAGVSRQQVSSAASKGPSSPPPEPSSSEDSSEGSAVFLVSEQPGPALLQVRVEIPTSLYSGPSTADPLLYLEAGMNLGVIETDDPLWYKAVLDNGTSGCVYGECVFRLLDDGTVSSTSLFEETAEKTFDKLKSQFPEGMYWNHMYEDIAYGEETPYSVTDTPCNHYDYGELYCNFYNGKTEELFPDSTLCQCLGFASLLSDQVFGEDAPLHIFYDLSMLRVGDHIRLSEWEHSLTVTAISDEGITIGEVNQDYEHCMITWSRELSWYELEGLEWDSEYITRYPMYPNEDGGFTPWED